MKRRGKAGGKAADARRPKAAGRKRLAIAKAKSPRRAASGLQERLERNKQELNEALQQRAATSEVLRLISAAPGDLQRVFSVILESATRLCQANFGTLYLAEGDFCRAVAMHNAPPAFVEFRSRQPLAPITGTTVLARVAKTKRTIQVADMAAEAASYKSPQERRFVKLTRVRSLVTVPMLKGKELIGLITVYRQEVRPFSKGQVDLLTSFAAQAVIAIENARLLNELRESLERQTATSEVLSVISSSPGDLEPVFQAMMANATRICEAKFGILQLHENGRFRNAAMFNPPPALAEYRHREPVINAGPQSAIGRVAATKQLVHIVDYAADPAYIQRDPAAVNMVERAGARTVLLVPMLKDGEHVGNLNIFRQEVRPFTDKQIELVQNFAAQAVIAIENTRLLSELRQSLEQQTATSNVLRVISSSPGALEPVFTAMLENATRICDAKFGIMTLYEGGPFRAVALHNAPPEFAEARRREPLFFPAPSNPLARVAASKATLQIPDLRQDECYLSGEQATVVLTERGGARTLIDIPMLKDGELVGVFGIYRQEVRPFTDKQIELLQNFAAQAVIAIENTRLLNELRQRTDDLTEALEQQTTTAEILGVISKSLSDTQPVFDAIVQSGVRLFSGAAVSIALVENGMLKAAAVAEREPVRAELWRQRFPFPLTREYMHSVAILDRKMLDIPNVEEAPAEMEVGRKNFLESGYRAATFVPLMRGETAIGALSVVRVSTGPLSEKQLAALQTYASQAVIAIENTRLLNELRQRTDDLTESLEQQTATSEVLGIISSSPGEVDPVFETILRNATRICEARFGTLALVQGDGMRVAAMLGAPRPFEEARQRDPAVKGPLMRLFKTKAIVSIADLSVEHPYENSDLARLAGARTFVGVPMFKDEALVGAIAIYRQEVRPFTDKHISLLQNFAAQAVIAIENTRLLNELRQRTDDLSESLEQQTATADVLKVISASPGELEPVFQAMLENATRICEAKFGTMYFREGDGFRAVAMYGAPPAYVESRLHKLVHPGPNTSLGRAVATKQVVQIEVAAADPGYAAGDPMRVAAVDLGGVRTLLSVPLLKDNELVGAISIYRQEVRPFTDKQTALVQNFAAQAVIAIENTRLLDELRQSLEQQTATADVLKVISRSTFDVQTVLDTLTESAVRLCHADKGAIFLRDDDQYRIAAIHGFSSQARQYALEHPIRAGRGTLVGRVALSGNVTQIPDVLADPEYEGAGFQKAFGFRTNLGVPLLRDGVTIGVFSMTCDEVKPFTGKQIELVTTFADQAVIALENARLVGELRQSLEQQTATADVLRVISSSPGELEPVFQAMLENATRICEAEFGFLWLAEDGGFRAGAMHGAPPEVIEERRRDPILRPRSGSPLARVAAAKRVVHIVDVAEEVAQGNRDPALLGLVERAAARTVLLVPMLKEDEFIGVISIYRKVVHPFADKQIDLVKNFANQAVIAIENTRLLNELRQSLEQQTATADVLRVISSSPGELEPVFNAMLENATRICEAKFGVLQLCEDGGFRMVAMHNAPPVYAEARRREPVMHPSPLAPPARVAQTKRLLHVADMAEEQVYKEGDPSATRFVELAGVRTLLVVPMLKEQELIGEFSVYRQEVRPFTDKQIELVQNFAAQAVIAIENTRLLNELRQSLEQQTATADVLRVISSSPGELEPVFRAMLENATRICEAEFGSMLLRDGDRLRRVAIHNAPPSFATFNRDTPVVSPSASSSLKRVMATKQVVHITDLQTDDPNDPLAIFADARTIVTVPLLKDNEVMGIMGIFRQEVRAFTDKQIELVQNFAAQAVIAIENTRLLNELRQRTDDLTEALEQQTVTAEVLRVISTSPGDLQPVFEAILENATRICQAKFGQLFLAEDGTYRAGAMHNVPTEYLARRQAEPRVSMIGDSAMGKVAATKQAIQIADVMVDPGYQQDEQRRQFVAMTGARTIVSVPMLKDGDLVGAINVYRAEVRPFTDKQMELLTNFATQAVIAIENTRLLAELRQSLQQQTATADVLKVISRSTFDLPAVLNTLVDSAAKLCDAENAFIFRLDDGAYRLAANHEFSEEYRQYIIRNPIRPGRGTLVGRTALEARTVHMPDCLADPEYVWAESQKIGGFRTMLGVPLLREGHPIGVIALTRSAVKPFTDKQIELVETFADQAVIAIENVRLFEAEQRRTEELSDALDQQTATADVLKVISRSTFDLQTVLDTLTESAARVCAADKGVIFQRDGDLYRLGANYGFSPDAAQYALDNPQQAGRGSAVGRVALEGKVTHIPDVLADPEYSAAGYQRAFGFRTILGVPLLRDGTTIGVFALTRDEVNPFTQQQIDLVTTFADQAVIAIENVRLFEDVQKRTDDLTESLEQQTAIGEILRVISNSPSDVQPVLDSVAEHAARICEAQIVDIFLVENDTLRDAASFGDLGRPPVMKLDRSTVSGRSVCDLQPVHIADLHSASEEFALGRELAIKFGHRSILAVPLIREGRALGTILVRRAEVRPFEQKDIALLTTFADQAAIAIENVRLFKAEQQRTEELSDALEQQTATADVLKIISRSTFDLQTVLNTLAESAVHLCEADIASIHRQDGADYRARATFGAQFDARELGLSVAFAPGRGSIIGRTVLERRPVQVVDVLADPDYTLQEMQKKIGFRTILGVPLLRDGNPVGVIILMRLKVQPFTDKQIELATTFADQAGIAIENVRLFEEIQDKSRQVEEASKHKSQFLANMSHELRTPLNAILGYTELIIDGIYGEAPEKMRTVMERVQSNGKHLLGLINDVLDLSKIEAGQLVLSIQDYSIKDVVHGVYSAVEPLASGKKLAFKIEVPANLPPARGDDRRLTQVLLNLVGNAIKFTDTGEVAVKAAASNGSVTISVHDTGPGIAEADQAKIFEEFQQADSTKTKAKGGTGLGLSIAKRIIEMHGGTLWVESSLGAGSTFSFSVPLRVEHQAGRP